MHDLDRTLQELDYDQEYDGFEYDQEADQYGEYDEEYDDSESGYEEEYYDGEYDEEFDDEYDDEMGEVLFSEEEEMDLAAELLGVGSEEELDEFFKRFFRRAGRRLRKFGGGLKRVVRGIGKVGKAIVKRALPIAGRVVGAKFGGPLGSKIGGAVGNAASNMFELDMETMSPEDRDFEVARRVVRLAGSATKKAAKLGQRAPANKAIRQGFKAAARRHAPGLLKPRKARPGGAPSRPSGAPAGAGKIQASGKWIMRDNKIIVMGL
jgi:hypothetical protein